MMWTFDIIQSSLDRIFRFCLPAVSLNVVWISETNWIDSFVWARFSFFLSRLTTVSRGIWFCSNLQNRTCTATYLPSHKASIKMSKTCRWNKDKLGSRIFLSSLTHGRTNVDRLDVAQGRISRAPDETRTHSCRFTSLAC